MDGKKSFAFTIDSILSADNSNIPSLEGDCEGKPASESANQTDLRSNACMSCCFCSHCGEILHTAASKSRFIPSNQSLMTSDSVEEQPEAA
ncbi:hypothetical protein QQF64_026347 [Cirrhinus molitorella]|uniref:Uncharacterized protein n=1 Tax=Cirrhinus molitorella TaxID=172907 RepID=A0ABR3N9R8_9TELE